TSPMTMARFAVPGTYRLRLTASDGAKSASNELTVVVTVANRAPVVDAGPDQQIPLSQPALVSATATDDGLPYNSLSFRWSVEPTDRVTIDDVRSRATKIRFGKPGVYVARFTAS